MLAPQRLKPLLGTLAALGLLLAIGAPPRLLGISWGLPDRPELGAAPFHPDERVPYQESLRLYREPRGMTFVWGGSHYIRLAWLARQAAEQFLERAPGSSDTAFGLTLLLLRAANVGFALLTAAASAWIGCRIGGRRVGLGAAALSLAAPGPVLDAHHARPDVLIGCLSTLSLALSLQAAAARNLSWFAAAGFATGASIATMLSGAIGLGPLLASGIARWRGETDASRRRICGPRIALLAVAGLGIGVLACDWEALSNARAFAEGLEIARTSHGDGGYVVPWRLLGYVPLQAFGTPMAIASGVGLAMLVARRRRSDAIVAVHLVFGMLLLGRVGFDMMRHLEFLVGASSAAASLALVAAGRQLARAAARPSGWIGSSALAAAVLYSLQLSIGYTWPLEFEEDPRFRAGRWIAEHASGAARVGSTQYSASDMTFVPRFPPGAARPVERLLIRADADPTGYLARGLDYIATTDAARRHAAGVAGRRFFRELFAGERYVLEAEFAPARGPLVSIERALRLRLPSDLLYLRSRFYVFGLRGPLARKPGG